MIKLTIQNNIPYVGTRTLATWAKKTHSYMKSGLKSCGCIPENVNLTIDGEYLLTQQQTVILSTLISSAEKAQQLRVDIDTAFANYSQSLTPSDDSPTIGQLVLRQYLGKDIQFEVIKGKVMANATLIAKAFDKDLSSIFKTKSWLDFEKAVFEEFGAMSVDLRKSKMGSPEHGGGTWIHQELVLELAGRLNPKFKLWCNRQIAELLKNGTAPLLSPIAIQEPSYQINDPIKRAERWIEEKQQSLQTEEQLAIAQPKAVYTDQVLATTNGMSITVIAKELGLSAQRLNELLRDLNIQYKQGNTWFLKAQHQDKGYTVISTYLYMKDSTSHQLKWTEAGRHFIHERIQSLKVNHLELANFTHL